MNRETETSRVGPRALLCRVGTSTTSRSELWWPLLTSSVDTRYLYALYPLRRSSGLHPDTFSWETGRWDVSGPFYKAGWELIIEKRSLFHPTTVPIIPNGDKRVTLTHPEIQDLSFGFFSVINQTAKSLLASYFSSTFSPFLNFFYIFLTV